MNKKEYFKPYGKALESTLTIPVTIDEKIKIKQVATDRKLSISQFVRIAIDNELKR